MARKHTYLALAAACVLAACGGKNEDKDPAPPDLLGGAGTFTGALDPDVWHFQGPDEATFAVEACAGFKGNCARVAGADLGARSFDAQLVYWDGANVMPRFLTLRGGKQYRIRLRGSASAADKSVQVSLEDGLYQVVGQATFTLGTAPTLQTGEPIVLPAAGGDRNVSLRVNVGGDANDGVTLSLDDLRILEENGPPPVNPGGNDLLADGDMESSPGSASWNRWGNATFSIEDCSANGFSGKCFRAASSDFGPEAYSTQLVKWNGSSEPAFYTLDPAKDYEVKLRARAAAPGGVIQLVLQRADNGEPPFQHAFTLTDTATDYSFVPDVTQAESVAFKLNFISPAGTAQVIEVDDLQLLEVEPTP